MDGEMTGDMNISVSLAPTAIPFSPSFNILGVEIQAICILNQNNDPGPPSVHYINQHLLDLWKTSYLSYQLTK